MCERLEKVRQFREDMNPRILDQGNLRINLFFTLGGKEHDNEALIAERRKLPDWLPR